MEGGLSGEIPSGFEDVPLGTGEQAAEHDRESRREGFDIGRPALEKRTDQGFRLAQGEEVDFREVAAVRAESGAGCRESKLDLGAASGRGANGERFRKRFRARDSRPRGAAGSGTRHAPRVETDTRILRFDRDGSANGFSATVVATLQTGASMTAGDIFLI